MELAREKSCQPFSTDHSTEDADNIDIMKECSLFTAINETKFLKQ
jgi:hypothetical protein